MKLNIITLVFYISLLCLSCEPGLVYENAVPPGIPNLTEIPNEYQGSFVCNTDSTRVYVTAHAVLEEYYHRFVTTVDKISASEECVIIGRGILFKEHEVCVPFEYIDEKHVTGKIYKLDTLFSVSEKQVVRQYNGHLFFNYQLSNKSWAATMLSPTESGGFTLRLLDMEEDTERIESVTENVQKKDLKDDKIQYVIDPSLIEFDEIIKGPNRTACDEFIRVNASAHSGI